VAVVAAPELLGRGEEVARTEAFLDGVPAGPRALTIRGEAGIGKTALWRAGLAAAEARGLTVLATRCLEAELPLAFVGLADLAEHALADAGGELTDAQREALAAAAGLAAPTRAAGDPIVLPRAFLALLRALARVGPVLVAVDDVQWLDPPTARVLSFAIRRLREEPVGLLVTWRGDEPDPLALARTLEERGVEEVWLGGLSLGALAKLVRSRLDARVPRPVLARVHAATDGNPLFALEFARSLAERAPGLAPLPIPDSLQELVRARVRGYPKRTRPLLAVVAAAERPTVSLLTTIDRDAPRLLDAAVDAGALAVGSDGGVRFTHPLLAAAVYAALAPSRRRAVHAAIAGVAGDLEERARHRALAAAGPDADVASLLAEAAERAAARGAPDAAAELAQEAVRLTPSADRVAWEERMLRVADYLANARELVAAGAWVNELLASNVVGERRARALLVRYYTEADVDARRRTIVEALHHAGDDPRLRARILLIASLDQLHRENVAASESLAREALAEAEQSGDQALVATALAAVAARAAIAGGPEPELLERSIALADLHGTLPRTPPPRLILAEHYLDVEGDLVRARRLLEAELDVLTPRGREFEAMRLLEDLSFLEVLAGNWVGAECYLDELWELSAEDGFRKAHLWPAKARLAALKGQVEEARNAAEAGVAWAEARWPAAARESRWAVGLLELSLGDPARAWDLLAGAAERVELAWALLAVPDAVEALIDLGRPDEAEPIITAFEARWSGQRWGAAAALRCRALLLLARGEAAAAAETAEQAAARFAAGGVPFDRARALLIAGEALRRRGERRRAAEKLQEARTVFAGLGAALWLERAEREMRRASPRPRRDRELTAAERQVAALVAAGKKNREVAAQLFTTVATVEAHLTRIYRKLGVRSRTELARGVAAGTLSLADE
jgi:DNA-binding NarL/FixJ family response regulator